MEWEAYQTSQAQGQQASVATTSNAGGTSTAAQAAVAQGLRFFAYNLLL